MTKTIPFLVGFLTFSSLPVLAATPKALGSFESAAILKLSDYLEQVKQNHPTLKASSLTEEAAENKKSEVELLFSPYAFGTAQSMWDQKKNLSIPYTQMNLYSSQVGLMQNFKTGTNAKLSYQLSQTELQGIPNLGKFYEGKTSLELNQPLLKNAWGSELKAQSKQATLASEMKVQTEKLTQKSILLEAEGVYYRLALAQESLKIAQDTLDRTEKMHQWSSRRSSLSLADSSDALQTQAAVELRKLQLLSAEEENRAALKLFNRARGRDTEYETNQSTLEKLELPKPLSDSANEAQKLQIFGKSNPKTEQSIIAEMAYQLANESETLAKSKHSPSLDVFGSIAFNSNENSLSSAFSQSAQPDRPTYAVGIKFQAPLDFSSIQNTRTAALKDKLAAETQYLKKLNDEKTDYQFLKNEYEKSFEKLKLAEKIERLQKDKLESERSKLSRGRSTTAQVLTFEEDYAQSRLNRIRLQASILQIEAQMKLFL